MQEPNLTRSKATSSKATSSKTTSSEVLPSLDITSLEAAIFLVGGARVQYLLPFFGKECSVSEGAKAVKLPLANMRYWVTKMEELGLIRLTKTVKRKGSPIKYYRSVADEFRVLLKSIPMASLEELLEQREERYIKRSYKALAKALVGHESDWYVNYLLEDGIPTTNIKPEQGTAEDAQVLSYWMPLRLNPEQAKALRDELRDMQGRYAKLHEENVREKHKDTSFSITHLFSVRER
jgi:DNA-binding transcriptional ArsR family regulator